MHFISLPPYKDASKLHLDSTEAEFGKRLCGAADKAISQQELIEQERRERRRSAFSRCRRLAKSPRILDRVADTARKLGVVGEDKSVKLVYLVLVSRLLPRPVSLAVKGPSSAGKSYLVEQMLKLVPSSAYCALTAMSERALAYSEEPLQHRFLVLFEAAGLSSTFASYLVRSLLSEGRLRYETVEKTEDGLRTRVIEREGPTGLITTTTKVHLHPENETRLLSIAANDTPEQTKEVMAALAERDHQPEVDLDELIALQEWLELAEHSTIIPFAGEIARKTQPVAVRLRRDFGALLNLVQAHAILHQAQRRKDGEGKIIAELEDYAAVRELVADLIAEGVDVSVRKETRETVDAVANALKFAKHREDGVSLPAVAAELGLDKSSASRRVKVAVDSGYLRNMETRKGCPARLISGDPLPWETQILPDVGDLTGSAASPQRCALGKSRRRLGHRLGPTARLLREIPVAGGK